VGVSVAVARQFDVQTGHFQYRALLRGW